MSQMSCSQRFKNTMSLFLHETRECDLALVSHRHTSKQVVLPYVYGVSRPWRGQRESQHELQKLIGQYRCGGAEKQRVNLYSSN